MGHGTGWSLQAGFLGIDPEDPREGYRDMEEFRRFKDVLIQAPSV